MSNPIKHLYTIPAGKGQQFSATTDAAGQKVYRKDVARVGRYYVPNAKMWTDIDAQRLDHWVEQFGRFKEAGRLPYFTVDHKPGAEAKRGEITSLFRDGDRLMADIVPSSAEADRLIRNNPHVSIEADGLFVDDKGNRYEDIITAVSAVTHPVIADQGPFVPLAASVAGGQTAQGVRLLFGDDAPGDNRKPPRENRSMFTDEQLNQVKASLKLAADATEEQVATAIVEALAKLAELQTQVAEQEQTVLSLKGQVTQLEKGKVPEVDTDVLEQTAELVSEKLSLLVERGNITKAIADEAAKLMLGTTDNRPKLMLSAKVAKSAGFDVALHKPLLDLLGKLNMGVQSGQRTGSQHMSLPRNVPDGDGRPTPETIKSMADSVYGPSDK